MNIKPPPIDDNHTKLVDYGSEIVTKRVTGITTGGTALTLPCDCKRVLIHMEGATEIFRVTGTVTGSTEIRFTSDGADLGDLPIAIPAETTIVTMKAPTGTINVSMLGVR